MASASFSIAPVVSASLPRTVATDALDTLGTILVPLREHRDAIHLAVEPVVAAEDLAPSDDIGLTADGRASKDARPLLGKVDPFLPKEPGVKAGETFWMLVYPGQIQSLRHVWNHPLIPELRNALVPFALAEDASGTAAPPSTGAAGAGVAQVEEDEDDDVDKPVVMDPEAVSDSREWIEEFANCRLRVSGKELIAATKLYLDKGKWFVGGGAFDGESIPDKFWPHFSLATGRHAPEDKQHNFISCSC